MKPSYTDAQGRKWKKYGCSFRSPDGEYLFHVWAISHEHALLQLQALKETATVDGEIMEEGSLR